MTPPTVAQPIDFARIRALVEQEMASVDRLILSELSSDVVLINQIGHYIVNKTDVALARLQGIEQTG